MSIFDCSKGYAAYAIFMILKLGKGVQANVKSGVKDNGGAYITDMEAGRYNITITSDERDESCAILLENSKHLLNDSTGLPVKNK